MRVDVIEAGFPAASSPKRTRSRRWHARCVDRPSAALARAVPFDIDAAGRPCATPSGPRIHVFVNSSDVHLAHQLRKDRDDVLAMTRGWRCGARGNHTDDVEFSPMDATRADPEFVAAVVREALAAERRRSTSPIRLAAYSRTDLEAMIRDLFERVPEARGGRGLVPRPGRSGPRDRECDRGRACRARVRSSWR